MKCCLIEGHLEIPWRGYESLCSSAMIDRIELTEEILFKVIDGDRSPKLDLVKTPDNIFFGWIDYEGASFSAKYLGDNLGVGTTETIVSSSLLGANPIGAPIRSCQTFPVICSLRAVSILQGSSRAGCRLVRLSSWCFPATW